MAETKTTRSLVMKLANVMAALDTLDKKGKNKEQGYSYAREADVTDAVRKLLAENGVILRSHVQEFSRNELTINGKSSFHCVVQMVFEFIDADTGETQAATWYGVGVDQRDKDVWKAYTGAMKTFLMKTFLMSADDDPEKDDAPPAREQRTSRAVEQKPPDEPKPAKSAETKPDKITMMAKWFTKFRRKLGTDGVEWAGTRYTTMTDDERRLYISACVGRLIKSANDLTDAEWAICIRVLDEDADPNPRSTGTEKGDG